MTEHDLVKGIDTGPIALVMLAEFARLFVVAALALGVMGFCIVGIARVIP